MPIDRPRRIPAFELPKSPPARDHDRPATDPSRRAVPCHMTVDLIAGPLLHTIPMVIEPHRMHIDSTPPGPQLDANGQPILGGDISAAPQPVDQRRHVPVIDEDIQVTVRSRLSAHQGIYGPAAVDLIDGLYLVQPLDDGKHLRGRSLVRVFSHTPHLAIAEFPADSTRRRHAPFRTL